MSRDKRPPNLGSVLREYWRRVGTKVFSMARLTRPVGVGHLGGSRGGSTRIELFAALCPVRADVECTSTNIDMSPSTGPALVSHESSCQFSICVFLVVFRAAHRSQRTRERGAARKTPKTEMALWTGSGNKSNYNISKNTKLATILMGQWRGAFRRAHTADETCAQLPQERRRK
jgi:hypothetical protein